MSSPDYASNWPGGMPVEVNHYLPKGTMYLLAKKRLTREEEQDIERAGEEARAAGKSEDEQKQARTEALARTGKAVIVRGTGK